MSVERFDKSSNARTGSLTTERGPDDELSDSTILAILRQLPTWIVSEVRSALVQLVQSEIRRSLRAAGDRASNEDVLTLDPSIRRHRPTGAVSSRDRGRIENRR